MTRVGGGQLQQDYKDSVITRSSSIAFFSYIFQTIRAYLPLAAGRPQRKRATNPQILQISAGFGVYGLKNELCDKKYVLQ